MTAVDVPKDKLRKLEKILNQVSELRFKLYTVSQDIIKFQNNITGLTKTLEEFLEKNENSKKFVESENTKLTVLMVEFVNTMINETVSQEHIPEEDRDTLKEAVKKAILDDNYDISLVDGKLTLKGLSKEAVDLLSLPEETVAGENISLEDNTVRIHSEDNWINAPSQ